MGIAGFPPGGLGAPGFAPTGGGAGLGLFPTGGGGALPAPRELVGRELEEVAGDEVPFVPFPLGVFFQGVADPLDGAIPGKTAIGFADGLAETDCGVILGADEVAVFGAAGAGGAAGALGAAGGGGGGGGGAAAALGLGGTSSR